MGCLQMAACCCPSVLLLGMGCWMTGNNPASFPVIPFCSPADKRLAQIESGQLWTDAEQSADPDAAASPSLSWGGGVCSTGPAGLLASLRDGPGLACVSSRTGATLVVQRAAARRCNQARLVERFG